MSFSLTPQVPHKCSDLSECLLEKLPLHLELVGTIISPSNLVSMLACEDKSSKNCRNSASQIGSKNGNCCIHSSTTVPLRLFSASNSNLAPISTALFFVKSLMLLSLISFNFLLALFWRTLAIVIFSVGHLSKKESELCVTSDLSTKSVKSASVAAPSENENERILN